MTPTMTKVTSASGQDRAIISAAVLTTVIKLLMSCGMDWEIIWRSVSVSLVYTDIISPWAWLSK